MVSHFWFSKFSRGKLMLQEVLIFYAHVSLMSQRLLEPYRNNMSTPHTCSQKSAQYTLSVIPNLSMTS